MIPRLPQFGQGRPLVSSLDQFKKPAALERYLWAAKHAKVNGWKTIVDAACGCGYGSHVLSSYGGARAVGGIDLDEIAIEVANKYWKSDSCAAAVGFTLSDIRNVSFTDALDVVVSIETIEHVEEPRELLTKFREWAPNLISTVPNEEVIPFNHQQYRHHYRHYTPAEFGDLLKEFYSDTVLYHDEVRKEIRAISRGARE